MWRPILPAAAARSALDCAKSIGAEILERGPIQDVSLHDGVSGVAVFLTHLGLACGEERYLNAAVDWLGAAVDGVATSRTNPGLITGFTGVGWAVEHLRGRAFEPNGEDPNAELDTALLELVGPVIAGEPWPGGFDLMTGFTGFGIYALERLRRPSAAELLRRVVLCLEATAECHEAGLAWHTPVRFLGEEMHDLFPRGAYNLGAAHGSPGVIAFLAHVRRAGVETERVTRMAHEAVRWLLSHRLSGFPGTSFSQLYSPDTDPTPARASWCYGNAGIAPCLWAAGHSFDEPDWCRIAVELAVETAQRPPAECGVEDICLCHGSAGLAHILNRLFQASGDERIGAAARFWIEETLRMRRPGEGVAGFLGLRYLPGDGPRFIEDPGLLGGAAGVGLALVAAASAVEPAWDRVLLIS
ncbi:MAG TPA: lanthionine synthetase C family protein [Candidatus Polarisedimenticolaceae bacterium]|nr:lanthionine synthetase C family protein [Candidatus Polarisedimenticolaceae bacterium]